MSEVFDWLLDITSYGIIAAVLMKLLTPVATILSIVWLARQLYLSFKKK